MGWINLIMRDLDIRFVRYPFIVITSIVSILVSVSIG